LVERATRNDFANYLVEDILVKVDRASMLNSLEMRVPFLDHRIIEFAFGSVPTSLKATLHDQKILLKKLARRVFPSNYDWDRKQGFSIPLVRWLRAGPWRSYIEGILMDATDSPFSREVVLELLASQSRGRANNERLFALAMFELWRREYRASF
jgi:asparagine synthase (glutamine-hydrolysing)